MLDSNVLLPDIIRIINFRPLVFSQILNLPLIKAFQKIFLFEPDKFRVSDTPGFLVYNSELFNFPHWLALNQLKLGLAVAKRNNLGISFNDDWVFLRKVVEVLLPLDRFHVVCLLLIIYIIIVFIILLTLGVLIRTTIAFTFPLARNNIILIRILGEGKRSPLLATNRFVFYLTDNACVTLGRFNPVLLFKLELHLLDAHILIKHSLVFLNRLQLLLFENRCFIGNRGSSFKDLFHVAVELLFY